VGKKLLAVVIALVAAQAFSGCYVLRELSWGTDNIKPGNTSTATIGLQGSEDTVRARGLTASDGRFFLTLIGEGGEGLTLKRPKFDSNDQLGEKQKLIKDDELFDVAFNGDTSCSNLLPFRRQGSPPGILWRTEADVVPSGKFIQSKMKAKVASDAPGGGFFGIVLSGQWIDDGDDVPEDPGVSDDQIDCSGFTTTTLGIKGPVAP